MSNELDEMKKSKNNHWYQ